MTKIIIIGAGMAGLSAGCFLQKNGYRTEIYEMGQRAGGLCTAWKRKDYTIDGCIHWLVGVNPTQEYYKIWDVLLDMKSLKITPYGEFFSMDLEGKNVRLYADADRLNAHLKEMSPEDGEEIDRLTDAIRRFPKLGWSEKAPETMGLIEKAMAALKMIPDYFFIRRYDVPLKTYAKRFKSPHIRKFLITAYGADTPAMILLLNASWFDRRNVGYPHGGAQGLVSKIVERYQGLGGKIHYGSKVERILVEGNMAKGIEVDGKRIEADIVVSAADGRTTIMGMLEGKFLDPEIKKLYLSGKYEPNASTIYVALGIKRKFDESYKPYVFIDLKKPMIVDGKDTGTMGVTIHNFDPEAAPKGKTVVTVMVGSSDPKYWISLRKEKPKEYLKQKNAIANQVVDELDAHFGDIKDKIEVLDVATPATYERYTGNWNGANMGWTDPSLFINKPKKEIGGVKNFYMCGQWVGDVGLPGAITSGRDVAQIICKRDGKEFKG